MAVLSADSTAVSAHRGNCRRVRLTNGVSDETYYKGAIVYYLGAGKITPVNAADLVPAGIVAEASDGAIGTSATVDVWVEGEFLIAYATPAVTDEGQMIYTDISAASDNPADLLPAGHASISATNDIAFGRVIQFVSSTAGSWVRIDDKSAVTLKA